MYLSIEQYLAVPLWVFVIMCIVCSIFILIAIGNIVLLQIAWWQEKKDRKTRPRNLELERLLREAPSGYGGYSTTSSDDVSHITNFIITTSAL